MVLNKALIKRSEESAVESGAFSFKELMLSAGRAAAEKIIDKYGCKDKKITVVCGSGNNGGDGAVIAGILAENGAEVSVLTPLGKPKTEQAEYYFDKLSGVKLAEGLTESDIIIDALFGIGLDRELSGEICELVGKINSADAIRVAVDIPSGVEADSGKILGAAVKADFTVTFIALKPCFLLPDGSDYCGEVMVADIGVNPMEYSYDIIKKPIFPKRRHNAHKGDFGTALMFCGSYGMAGAAILSAKAAVRSGVGILRAAICDNIYDPFTASVPEAVCHPLKPNGSGTLTPSYMNLPELLKGAKALLVGCGLGNNNSTKQLVTELIKNAEVPLVIDADGINAIAGSIDIIKTKKAPVILTPHPGEMARLTGKSIAEIEQNRVSIARDFAKEYNCILVLKGANTIVAEPDGKICFNITGNAGMATAGSGDVLAGITLSLLAQGIAPTKAARAAVYLHGEAGDKATSKRGERAVIAGDIVEEL